MAGRLPYQWLSSESDAHAGDSKHGKIVGAIAYRDYLVERDIFLQSNFSQQLGLACAVYDRRPNLSAHHAIHDVQIISKDVVDPQTLLQMLSEEIEPSREDRRFVAKHLESSDQLLGPFNQRNGVQQLSHSYLFESAKQRHPAPETLLELNFSAHRRLGDLHHLVAYTSQLCQLINHLALNQRGIHVEGKQPPVATEDALSLESDVDFQIMSGGEKCRAHRRLRRGIPIHHKLDTGVRIGS